MQLPTITTLIKELNDRYAARWGYFGTTPIPPEDNLGFKISGIEAVFSVSTQAGRLPLNVLDIQIESEQPGHYIFTSELTTVEFLELLPVYEQPMERWPLQN